MSNRKQRRADKARRREYSAAQPVYEKMVQFMLTSPKVKVVDPKYFDDSAHTFGALFRLRGTPPFMHQREIIEEVDRTYFDGCYADGEQLLAQDVLQLWVKGDRVQVKVPGLHEQLKAQANRLAAEYAFDLSHYTQTTQTPNQDSEYTMDLHSAANALRVEKGDVGDEPPVKLSFVDGKLVATHRATGEEITKLSDSKEGSHVA